jgi:hypothetical protein
MNANISSLFWEGFTVDSFTHPATDALLITLRSDPGFPPSCRLRCPRCGIVTEHISWLPERLTCYVSRLDGISHPLIAGYRHNALCQLISKISGIGQISAIGDVSNFENSL